MTNISKNKIQEIFAYSPDIKSLDINLENISKAMGYDDSKTFPYANMLRDIYLEARKIAQPKCGFVLISDAECFQRKGEIVLKNVVFKTGKIISSPLSSMTKAVLYVGTVGKGFDKWLAEKKKENDPLKEYISNLIGSEIAESISKWIYLKIVEFNKSKKMNCSNRYSPGYCGWSVEEQAKLFSFFPKEFCNIHLTDSALMLPIKSVSGLVGVGKNIEYTDYPCDVCNAQHCYKNRRSVLV